MVDMPQNDFTQMIDRVKMANSRGRIEGPITGTPLPSTRSAAMNAPLPPLTDRERDELDAEARRLGVMPAVEGETGQYATLEEAMAAGRPITDDLSVQGKVGGYQTAREFIGTMPRIPDFSEIGGIDLIRGVVYLDGMEFSIPKKDVDKFRLYVLKIARADIARRMKEAMANITSPGGTPDGGTTGSEDVSAVSEE